MRIFFKFVATGLFFGGLPEIVDQIYIRHSVASFWSSIYSYIIFLLLLFFVRKLFKQIKSKFISTALWYIMFGLLGLIIEWQLLGNADVAWYGQISMFTFWAALAFMPVLFTEGHASTRLKKQIWIYGASWSAIFLVLGAINGGLGLMVWIFGEIWLNVYMIVYLRELKRIA